MSAITACASLLLFLFGRFFGIRRLGLASGHAGHQLVVGFLGGHFFFDTLVVVILVLVVAGTAAHLGNFFAHHGQHGVVGRPLAAGTMVVDVVAESHRFLLRPYYSIQHSAPSSQPRRKLND